MDEGTIRLTLTLMVPGTFTVFGLAFVGAWSIERKRTYLLSLAAACGLFSLGVCIQILQWPPDQGLSVLIACVCYTAAVLLTSSGLLEQTGQRLGRMSALGTASLILSLVWYFYYVEQSLLLRIYIMHFGYGLILLNTTWRLRSLWHARRIDQVLFLTLLFFSIQFFVRTLLTVGFETTPLDAQPFGHSVFWQTLQLSLTVLGASLGMSILAVAMMDTVEDLRRERDTDELTGLLNRRGFDERAQALLRSHSSTPSAILISDIDHFKRINDQYGHDVGDRALQFFSYLLMLVSNGKALVGRIGGEEFALLFPGKTGKEALQWVAQFQATLRESKFPDGQAGIVLSASFGITEVNAPDNYSSLLKHADTALYQAKQNGRNRAVLFELSKRTPVLVPLLAAVSAEGASLSST